MASKQEREAAARRAAKAEARFQRAAARRRERTIVASILAVSLVLVFGVLALINGLGGADDAATPVPSPSASPSASEPAATEPATDPSLDPSALPTTNPRRYDAPPPAVDSLGTTWTATLTTSVGDIVIELDGEAAPQAVASFNMLAKDGFFDGTACHRLLPDSLLQCGDPTATGTGGPGYSFGPLENAPADQVYPAGTVAMARPGGSADGMGSQFFLVFNEVQLPDDSAGGYTVFGTVTQGLDILQTLGAQGTQSGSSDGPPATAVIIEEVAIS